MNQNNNQNTNFKPDQKRFDKPNNKSEYKFDNKNSDYKNNNSSKNDYKNYEYKNNNNSKNDYNKKDITIEYNKEKLNLSENKSKVAKSYLSSQNNPMVTSKYDNQSNLPEEKKAYNPEYNKENKLENTEYKKANPNPNKNYKKLESKTSDKPTYVSKQAFIGDRKKPKKVYADDYEQDRDFKLNIYKKNIYATPYFQEKKRRNTFIGKKPKPKEEESWKKKHKKHSNKQND